MRHSTRASPYNDGTGFAQDPHDALHEAALEVTVRRRISVLLTCGGPNVAMEADLDHEGSITDARIVGHWGGVCIKRRLSQGSSVFRALETYAEVQSA